MPKVQRNTEATLKLQCDDPSDKFIVRYTNMGEPFREGINIGISNDEFDKDLTVMLGDSEAKKMRDVLLKLYPVGNQIMWVCPKCGNPESDMSNECSECGNGYFAIDHALKHITRFGWRPICTKRKRTLVKRGESVYWIAEHHCWLWYKPMPVVLPTMPQSMIELCKEFNNRNQYEAQQMIFFQQDDTAPDSLEFFERDFMKELGMTIQEFKDNAKIETCNIGFSWTIGEYCLEWYCDDPVYAWAKIKAPAGL